MGYLSASTDKSWWEEAYDWVTDTTLSWWDEQKVKDLIPEFPNVFRKAKTDWAKFLIGSENNLFTETEKKEVIDWFVKFPEMWETVRPNFQKDEAGLKLCSEVDAFIGTVLRSNVYQNRALGFAPIVIAGVIIVGGVAASLWAVRYIGEQNNISDLIDGVVTGQIPPEILKNAIDKSSDNNLFGNLQEILQWAAIAAVAWIVLPKLFGKK